MRTHHRQLSRHAETTYVLTRMLVLQAINVPPLERALAAESLERLEYLLPATASAAAALAVARHAILPANLPSHVTGETLVRAFQDQGRYQCFFRDHVFTFTPGDAPCTIWPQAFRRLASTLEEWDDQADRILRTARIAVNGNPRSLDALAAALFGRRR